MTARITVPADADLARIAAQAGAPELDDRRYEDGELIVAGVSQEALEAALADIGVEPHTPVPSAVTQLQARRTLRAAGLLEQVEAAMETADADTRDAWRYAQTIERDNPILTAVAAQLGVTDAQMDDLFRAAAAG